MITPIDSKLYMDGDQLMLWWTGTLHSDTVSTAPLATGSTVNLTKHIEEIVATVVGSAMRRNGMWGPYGGGGGGGGDVRAETTGGTTPVSGGSGGGGGEPGSTGP